MAQIKKAIEVGAHTIHNMPFKVTAKDVYDAILTLDTLGRDTVINHAN